MYVFKRKYQIKPKTIKKYLDNLPNEFTFKEFCEQQIKQEGGLRKHQNSKFRARIARLKNVNAIKMKPHPDDGRKALYVKHKRYRN